MRRRRISPAPKTTTPASAAKVAPTATPGEEASGEIAAFPPPPGCEDTDGDEEGDGDVELEGEPDGEGEEDADAEGEGDGDGDADGVADGLGSGKHASALGLIARPLKTAFACGETSVVQSPVVVSRRYTALLPGFSSAVR
jgi:hypothetical protein